MAKQESGKMVGDCGPDRRDVSNRDLRIALATICVLGILAVAAVLETLKLGEIAEEFALSSEHSHHAHWPIRETALLTNRAESSALQYMISGDDRQLADFERARQAAEEASRTLPLSFAESGAQQAEGARFTTVVTDHLAELSDLLDGYAHPSPTHRMAESEVGPVLPARGAVEQLADRLILLQDAEMQASSERLASDLQRSRITIVSVMISIIALLTALALLALPYVAHRNRVEQQLVRARQAAESANQAKSDFLATMSHEIRTPLASIVGYTELLLECDLTSSQRQFVGRVQANSSGLLTLVNRILDISKIEAGEVTIQNEALAVGELVSDLLSVVSIEARKKDVKLISDLDPRLPERVTTDGLRLRQVLLNLLSNAVKFTKQGSVVMRIRTEDASRSGNLVRFEICDTGIGIPHPMQDRLFRQFSQADVSVEREFGGTGLGLAITKRLVKLMGGEIGFDSEPGRGSVFWVVLPLPPAQAGAVETPVVQSAPCTPGGKILLVEDSPQTQDLVKAILVQAGCTVEVAADGAQAIQAVRTGRYDLILMDMQMPCIDGVETTRRIRQMNGPMQNVPIIALSANAYAENVELFSQAGTDDFVAKPFTKAALVETVARWLSAKQAERSQRSPVPAKPRTYDPIVLEEARELMGDSWTRAALQRLQANSDTLLSARYETPSEISQLERRAHQIVGEAAQLGFPELSQACSELEQACSHGLEIEPVRSRAQSAAQIAGNEIERLVRRLQSRPSRSRRASSSRP